MKLFKLALLSATAACALAAPAMAQVSGDKVKIGVLTDMSGTYSDVAGKNSIIAVQMAVDDFGGKVLGKPIEVVSADHQNKPDIGATKAREWIDTEGVDMITDLVTSSVGLAVQKVGAEKGIVTINNGAGTSELTGKSCSPTGFHWAYDTYSLAHGTGSAVVKNGGTSWFFITADYAFGHQMQEDASKVVKDAGGTVVGSVNHPFPNNDFSSFLLQAQGSGAKVVAFANAGSDTINSIKQAAEYGIVSGGQQMAALLVFLSDVHALGLKTAQGLQLTEGFYWDQSEKSREFSKRFGEKTNGTMPTQVHAGDYSATMAYLKAVEKAGTDDGKKVAEVLHGMKIDDMFTSNGEVWPNGAMAHDMLLAQVKTPEESKYPWDYYKIIATIPAKEAWQDPKDSGCPLVK